MIDRVVSIEDAVRGYLRRGLTIMVGGFGRGGVPFTILEHIADQPRKFTDLTLIKNDASEPHLGIGPLIKQGQVTKLISTHIGLNPDFIARMNRGDIACELVPQGIFAERIRAGGAGIPAFLTDIGIGTEVGTGRPTVDLDGRHLLLERAMHGDVAIVCADVADASGNCWWRGSNRNMCVVMAMACRDTIIEAKEVVDIGSLRPEDVHLPGLYVSAVVRAQPRRHTKAGGIHDDRT
jgi:acetate CoA/acetoacetate CoA-transferase alpha subunit